MFYKLLSSLLGCFSFPQGKWILVSDFWEICFLSTDLHLCDLSTACWDSWNSAHLPVESSCWPQLDRSIVPDAILDSQLLPVDTFLAYYSYTVMLSQVGSFESWDSLSGDNHNFHISGTASCPTILHRAMMPHHIPMALPTSLPLLLLIVLKLFYYFWVQCYAYVGFTCECGACREEKRIMDLISGAGIVD